MSDGTPAPAGSTSPAGAESMNAAGTASTTPASPGATSLRAPLPVIVGCPRSGTSLLAVMLDAHPQLAVPPETAFLQHLTRLDTPPASLARQFVQIVTANRTPISNWSDFGLDGEEFARRIFAIEPFSLTAGTRAFYEIRGEPGQAARRRKDARQHLRDARDRSTAARSLHFIHVLRDPRDTALSWRKTWFAPSQDLSDPGAGVAPPRRGRPNGRSRHCALHRDALRGPGAAAAGGTAAALRVPVAAVCRGDA